MVGEVKRKRRKRKSSEEDNKLYDIDIRKAFIKRNINFFSKEGTYTVNEFAINSKTSIIDLINFDFNKNIITGFEIKSERDNLKKLPKQLKTYISFCNIVYVICHEKHVHDVELILKTEVYSTHVGIIKVTDDLQFQEVKKAIYSKPFFDSFIRNLDTEELSFLCEERGLNKFGYKKQLVDRLKLQVSFSDLYVSLKRKLFKYSYIKECTHCKKSIFINKTLGEDKDSYCLLCNRLIS